MRIERSKYTTPPSPVEAFRRVSSKIGRKATSSNEDDSNHRLLDHSSWDQSDDQREEDILPFNPTGKFVVKKTSTLSTLGQLKSPRSMKALMSRVNAVVEHNSYFGNHDSRDDDESNVGLLSRDGQYETRYESRWSDAGEEEDDESNVMQTSQSNNGATIKPLLPDLLDLGGFSDSSESGEENKGATATVISAPDSGQEHDGASVSSKQSLDHKAKPVEEVAQESQEEVVDDEIVDTSSTNDFDEEETRVTRVTAASAKPASLDLEEDNEIENSIELEGSSSTVDFDDDLPLAAEHPESTVRDQTPVEVEVEEEESEKKSIMSSPTDIKSYVSYTRHECPVVVSSTEHGDVILLSPKGFENIITAEVTPSVLSIENEEGSQDLRKKFEAIALTDPSVIDVAVETEQPKNDRSQEEEKADSDDEDEFVISDDWSEDNSVGNSSDPFGECFVNEAVVQNITEHRSEENATSNEREKIAEEEVNATDDDSPSEVSDNEPVPEASIQLADLETSQLTNKSSSSADLASFNQIWEGTGKMSEESGSDSEECDESKIGEKMSNDDDAWAVSRERMTGSKNKLSDSGSSGDDKYDSSESEEEDSFISLNNYWSNEWNDLTLDDSTNRANKVQDSLNEKDVDEDIEAHDKYSTELDEEDNDNFYGCGIVEGADVGYSYDSYGLETISEEEEFEEDESARSGSCIGVKNGEMLIPCDASKKELSEEKEELVSAEADKNDETVKECNSEEDLNDTEEEVTLAVKSSNTTRREVILVETVNEHSSDDDDESRVEEEMVQTTTSNHDLGAQSEVVQSEALHQLWSKIDEYQASSNNVEAVEQAPRQISTKAITPAKKHSVVKHSIRDRSPSPRAKRAGSTDRTFDDLSKFLDGADVNDASFDSSETGSNATEVLLEDGSNKIDADMKRTSVKRHVFTRLFAPVSALVTKRRASQQQDLGITKSESNSTDGSKEESDDDRQARELAELLSAAMMAREQEKMNKSAAFAKQLAEIREAMAVEQELAEIEGNLHYGIETSVESFESEDDSQIEILDEEIVTVTPTDATSNEIESKELHDLWSKIDEYHANGKTLDTTQVSMVADLLNSQMEEQQTSENTVACKSSTRPLRSSKHAVSIKKRAVVNAKAKKSKYDVSYIEAKSIVNKRNATEVVVDLVSAPEPSDIDEQSGEISPAEPCHPLIDLETQDTNESADLDAPPQLCLIPSAMSINSFASIISADKSSESSLGDVSKAGSDMSKSSLVSKLYTDNADLAETLASTQCELEKALKQLERMKMEKESQEKAVQSKPVPLPKSSFDDYFEADISVEEDDSNVGNGWNEADLAYDSGVGEI